MSDTVNEAVKVLSEKLSGAELPGTVKFAIQGEGSIMLDGSGARAGDEPADVTLTADVDTFKGILSGDTNPTSAFMSGKLQVDGDMGMAMQLATALA